VAGLGVREAGGASVVDRGDDGDEPGAQIALEHAVGAGEQDADTVLVEREDVVEVAAGGRSVGGTTRPRP
jgi:hypothetical protein